MIGGPAEKPSQVKGFEILKWDGSSERITLSSTFIILKLLGRDVFQNLEIFGLKKMTWYIYDIV